MKLREFLKIKRMEKGLSQEKLAKILGYSSGQFVSNWERGESFPPIDRLAKMTLLFGLEEELLLNLFLDESEVSTRKEFKKALSFQKTFE